MKRITCSPEANDVDFTRARKKLVRNAHSNCNHISAVIVLLRHFGSMVKWHVGICLRRDRGN